MDDINRNDIMEGNVIYRILILVKELQVIKEFWEEKQFFLSKSCLVSYLMLSVLY